MRKQGWTYKKLGEICKIARGGSPRPIKNYITTSSDGLNWIKIGDTDPQGKYIFSTKEKIRKEGLKKTRWVEENEFLLSNSMSFGRPYILKTNGCIHDGWLVLRDYQDSLFIDFFYYLLISPFVQKQFKIKAQGSTVSNLNTDRVTNIDITFPSLEEQGRIVARLDAAFAEIDSLKANAEQQLKEARALFQAALTQAMTPKPGWQEKTLKEICTVINGRAYSKNEMLKKGKYRLLRVGNFFTNDSWYYSDMELEENKYCDNGDLLYAWSASFGPRIWEGEKVIYHYHIWKMVCSPAIDKKFLFYWLDSDMLKKQAMTNLHGTTMAHITKNIIENAIVSFPSFNDQKRIASTLDGLSARVRELEEINRKTAAECDALKQAILRETFD